MFWLTGVRLSLHLVTEVCVFPVAVSSPCRAGPQHHAEQSCRFPLRPTQHLQLGSDLTAHRGL